MNTPITDLYADPRERRRARWRVVALLLALVAGILLADRAAADEPERYEPSSRGYDAVERWRPLVSQYGWDADTALAVIRCESGGDPTIPNRQGSGALGLFQIMPRWQYLADLLHGRRVWFGDPRVNVRTAYELYVLFDGWSPWWSSRGCWGAGW